MNIPKGFSFIHFKKKLNSTGAVIGVNKGYNGAVDCDGLVERERVDERGWDVEDIFEEVGGD